MLDTVFLRAAGLSALLAAAAAHAGPITTVPWNGYTGAASFGFDDGRGSQLSTLKPQLDNLGIKATFFIANNMYTFPDKKGDWTDMAKNGHEIANHSGNHNSPSAGNIADMAKILRAMDQAVEAVTYAYPDCKVTSDANGEAFLARGCQWTSNNPTYYAWSGNEPNWMNILGYCIQPGNASSITSFLDGAKTKNSWSVVFTHDVLPSGPDQYSVSASDNLTILNKAVSNKLWIATYATVGAYYRAHFTMDKVTASAGAGPWNLTWSSPNSKMPKSVKLKVKLDAATFGSDITVSQGGTAIAKNTDGSYTIEFMKLALEIKKGTSGVAHRSVNLDGIHFRREANRLSISGASNARVSVWTLSGTQVGFAEMDSNGAGWLALGNASVGSLVVRVTSVDGASSSLILPPVR